MVTKLEIFNQAQCKKELPDIRPGDTIRIYQKTPALVSATADKKEEDKKRIQTFEGLIIARKHGKEPGATIIVRKEILGVGVERTFPIHSPIIEKIEVIKKGKVRRAKLYYLRKAAGKRAKIKER